MVRWTIVLGAALVSGAALFFITRTYLDLTPTTALICAAAVTLGVGVIAHLNTPDSEELEDSLD
jgi:FtsH-binding integral membrane protein